MAINPIIMKAHPDFVALVRNIKKDMIDNKGIKLSDVSITKIMSDKWRIERNNTKWNFKIR